MFSNSPSENLTCQYPLNTEKGERWISATIIYLSSNSCLVCNRDVTQEKEVDELNKKNAILQATAEQRRSEDELINIVLITHGALISTYQVKSDQLNYHYLDDNKEAHRVTIEHFLGNKTLPFVHPDDQKIVFNAIKRAVTTGEGGTVEYRNNFKGGNWRYNRMQYATVKGSDGKVSQVMNIITDIDDERMNRILVNDFSSSFGHDSKDIKGFSFIEQMFKVFLDSSDREGTIQKLLVNAGKTIGVDHAYVIELDDKQRSVCNYDWYLDVKKDSLSKEDALALLDKNRDTLESLLMKNEFAIINDTQTLDKKSSFLYERFNVRSSIRFALRNEGKYIGFVAFDDCVKTHEWDKEGFYIVRLVSLLISALLEKMNDSKLNLENNQIIEAASKSKSLLYVVDKEHTIMYTNNLLRIKKGNDLIGQKCYKAFLNQNAPCEECPIKKCIQEGVSIPVEIHPGNGQDYFMAASPIKWTNKNGYLVTGSNVTNYKGSPEVVLQAKLSEVRQKYTQAFFDFFETVIELDFNTNKAKILFIPAYVKYINNEGSIKSILTTFVTKHVPAEQKKMVSNYFYSFAKNRDNPKYAYPSIEAQIEKSHDELIWYQISITKIEDGKYFACFKNINLEKKASLLLQENAILSKEKEDSARYQIIVEKTGAAVIENNYITGEIYTSSSYNKYMVSKLSQEEIFANKGSLDTIYPDDLPILQKFFKASQQKKDHVEVVLRVKMVDGSYRWTKMTGNYIYQKGKLIRSIGTFVDIDDEVKAKQALEVNSKKNAELIEHLSSGVAVYHLADKVYPVFLSDKALSLFGFSRKEYDQRIAQGLPVVFMPKGMNVGKETMNKLFNGESEEFTFQAQRKDGSYFWLFTSVSAIQLPDKTAMLYTTLNDISKTKELEEKQDLTLQRYRLLLENEGIITYDYTPSTDTMIVNLVIKDKGLIEKIIPNYTESFLKEDRHIIKEDRSNLRRCLLAACKRLTNGVFEYQADYRDTGTYRWYRAKYLSNVNEEGKVVKVVGRSEDISKEMKELLEIEASAKTDKLTGLMSKDEAISFLSLVTKKKPSGRLDALLEVDLDNFKKINDTNGHIDGDRVLKKVGETLKALFIPDNYCTARFGGDEFVVYLKSISDVENAEEVATLILKNLNKIKVKNIGHVSASIGIAMFGNTDKTFLELFDQADKAMYDAKNSVKNTYHIYMKNE